MTYIADLDPNNPATAAAEALVGIFDADFPGWEEREAGEAARYVDESDVENPDEALVWRYGYGHAVLIPAR